MAQHMLFIKIIFFNTIGYLLALFELGDHKLCANKQRIVIFFCHTQPKELFTSPQHRNSIYRKRRTFVIMSRRSRLNGTLERLSDDLSSAMDEMHRRRDRRVSETDQLHFRFVDTWPRFLPEPRQFWGERQQFWEERRSFWEGRERFWRARAAYWTDRERAQRAQREQRAQRPQRQQRTLNYIVLIRLQY